MKIYAKLNKGTLTIAPQRILKDDYINVNPTDEQLQAAGFYEVVYTAPESREGYTAKATWRKVRGKIRQTWKYEPIVE